MKKSMRSFGLALLLAACTKPQAPKPEPIAPPAAPSATPKRAQPTRFEIYRALMANADLPLGQAKHCNDVIGADAGTHPTLGDWIAYNLSVLENGTVTLPASCTADGAGWQCQTDFSVRNDSENVLWRWGVSFRLSSELSLDRSSVTCTGAG